MDFEAELQARDHRITKPRRLVWEVLTTSGRHLTAQEVTDLVNQQDDSINLSSVYRTLTLFAELNLARESSFGQTTRWEPAHPDDMIHLVCEECDQVNHHGGKLVQRLQEHLRTDHNFQTRHVNIVVNGICERCQTNPGN